MDKKCVSRPSDPVVSRPASAIALEQEATRIYFTEGFRGTNKFTFEVFRNADGQYCAVCGYYNRKTDRVTKRTLFPSDTKAGLRDQAYPSTREVKTFLSSDFWHDENC